METMITGLAVFAMVSLWLMAGVFLAFSDFVMRSFARVDDEVGITAMQSVNIWVVSSVFLLGLVAMVPVSVFFVVAAVLGWAPALFGCGGAAYLICVVAVSARGNIPLNDELAVVEAADPGSIGLWDRYLSRWVWLNHIRTLGCAGAAMAFTYGVAPSL